MTSSLSSFMVCNNFKGKRTGAILSLLWEKSCLERISAAEFPSLQMREILHLLKLLRLTNICLSAFTLCHGGSLLPFMISIAKEESDPIHKNFIPILQAVDIPKLIARSSSSEISSVGIFREKAATTIPSASLMIPPMLPVVCTREASALSLNLDLSGKIKSYMRRAEYDSMNESGGNVGGGTKLFPFHWEILNIRDSYS
ncbi:uncharacterized protein LOC143859056 isoform X2 [Tasmannia lanceolata]|uniref:uncharacterized protein LOC143859056 isoform X2 n=1 Tax=Tasmannia lanceolata TaxID=3420 RepID=UPI004064BA79